MTFKNYLWASTRIRIQLAIVLIIILSFLTLLGISLTRKMGITAMWQSWMELHIAWSTIIVAAFIGINELRQDWESRLPKRLDAVFYFNNDELFRVTNAPLTGGTDVRQWGQQIGLQMNNNIPLKFREFRLVEPKRDPKKNVVRYMLEVWLYERHEKAIPLHWNYDDEGRVSTPINSEPARKESGAKPSIPMLEATTSISATSVPAEIAANITIKSKP